MTALLKSAPAPVARPRGIVGNGVRADLSKINALVESIQQNVEEMRAAHGEEIAALKKGMNDPLATEKLDKINAEISAHEKLLEDMKATMSNMQVGAGDASNVLTPDARAHAQAFDRWFRRGVDANLADLQVKAELTTQSEPDGGFLTPREVSSTIDRVASAVSVMRQLATVISIGGDTWSKFVNLGGTRSGWVGEEEARPETGTPKLSEIIIQAHELYAFPFTTQKMLDDGIIDIGQWLGAEVALEFEEQEGAAHITGSGVKQPLGLLTPSKAANSAWEWGKVGFVATGNATGFKPLDVANGVSPADAFTDLYYALKQRYRQNARWLISDAVMGSVRKFKDGNGADIWAPPTAETPAMIMGKPVSTDDYMDALGANAFPVAFGDFKRAYTIVDRIGIRVLRDPYKVHGKVGFYTTKRTGGGVTNFEAYKLLKCAA